jgi:multicomponent Na+:H+ antiporter subunit D
MAGAIILPLLPKFLRSGSFILFPLLSLLVIWISPFGDLLTVGFAGYTLTVAHVDGLSRMFGTIFALITIIGGVYAYYLEDTGQQVAALLYAGGALGTVFAGDFLTLFIFWEIMAFSATYLIWARRTKESEGAGFRYVLVHLFGGGLLLSGILLHLSGGGSLELTQIIRDGSLSSRLILLGVALNAAVPPLHAWLADAYPKATVTGAVFLCAFTTKAAVYVLIRLFPGWEILIIAGAVMTLWGTIYALLSRDIREILAYSTISQVGYMVVGVGIGTQLALNGAVAHAFSHILYKSLLFMATGAVLYTTGTSKLDQLGGLAKYQRWIVGLYLVGAFSISGIPFLNGFISKSMIVSAAGYSHYEAAMFVLMLASMGTFLHTGLRLPYYTWFGANWGVRPKKEAPTCMIVGMGIAAFFCILFGIFPSLLYTWLPFDATYRPFTVPHLVEAVQTLGLTFVGFWLMKDRLAGEPAIPVDTDWFYRKTKPVFWAVFVRSVNFFFDTMEVKAIAFARSVAVLSKNPVRFFMHDESTDTTYSANRYRKPMSVILFVILVIFVVFAVRGTL